MDSDIRDEYVVGRARGSKHFTLTLVDEYGRTFPNTDTSQGFKNNLMLELSLTPGLMLTGRVRQPVQQVQ